MKSFIIEITDTFGGEANYSWVTTYRVKANNFRGAINKLSRAKGKGWSLGYHTGDMARYNLKGAAICCFVINPGKHGDKGYTHYPEI